MVIEYEWVKIGGPIVIALLMVTNVPMFNFKSFEGGLKGNVIQLVYVLSMLPILYFFQWVAIPVGIIWYVVLSVITIPIWRKG